MFSFNKIVFFALSLVSATASAAKIKVDGRAYSATKCEYFSASLADFNITYSHPTLPWGTEIFVRYGFHDDFRKMSWQNQGEVQARPTAPYTWMAELNKIVVDSRGYFSLSHIQFAIMIRLPDGEVYWDNGGKSNLGYYEAPTPVRTCTPGEFEIIPSVTK
ncbi:MAG: hypothetical protein JNM39_11795 [Bdellovibrionaceae bacterium]|nr:hypothetical protein [Pseudobdellovibrionaceae bacterium]